MFRAAILLFSGNSLTSLFSLARSVVIAHLISVSDFGIASTFALAMSIVEMISALGLQQQIVQHKDGDVSSFQSALQGLQAMRALLNGAVLFLLADPIAAFFGVPEVGWAYRLMALVPIMNGFIHMDIYRFKRRMHFVPVLTTTTVSVLISLILVWPLSWAFSDYRVMLYAVLMQSAMVLIISHLMAEQPYRLSFDRKITVESLRFGWPILLNGILLFLVFNGERMIVGRELGMAPLAVFSLAFSLVLTPTLVMEGSAQSFFLPQLSALRDDVKKFGDLAMATLQCHLLFGAVIVVGVALLGGPIVHLLLGPKYAETLPILTWLALMQGIRVSKGGSSAITLAHAFTENGLVASLMRVALLPLAWYVASIGGNIIYVIWLGIAGETLGFVASLWLARYRLRLSLRRLWPTIGAMVVLFVATGLHAFGQSSPDLALVAPIWTGLALVGLFGVVLLTMTDLWLYIRRRTATVQSE
jgi:O-antigen/teichoic acid export membrane protein